MSKYRVFALLLALPVLAGCLYVEVTGNVAGATVTVTPLRGGDPVIPEQVTTTVEDVISEHGRSKWNDWDGLVRLLFVGRVELDTDELEDDKYYLVTASGGLDMDWDVDGEIDSEGWPVEGEVHGIMTGAQLKKKNRRINLLTDAIYRLLLDELDDLDDDELGQRLDELASEAVVDINDNGRSDYADVLSWSQLNDKYPYPGSAFFLRRAEVGLAYDLPEELILLQSESLIRRADWRAADEDSLYAQILVPCSVPALQGDLCPLGLLPLIGQDAPNPEVDDIMARLVVTHDWMRERFRQVLERMPQDLLLMLRSVTTVVIGDEIRPSYYDPISATIFLDAGTLWVTAEEGATVSDEADYRAEFASQVDFAANWRYVKDNEPLLGPPDSNGDYQLEEIALDMAALLFHELAHAADWIPPAQHDSLPLSQAPAQLTSPPTSDLLTRFHPLESEPLRGVAAVLFGGFSPTPEEAGYTSEDIGEFFAPDRATDLYAYFSQFEDYAMLFEEFMMALHFGVQRDVGFTSIPGEDVRSPNCSHYQVGWGTRGRIAAPQLSERLLLVLEDLLPERDYSQEVANLEAPIPMVVGRDWCENIVLGEAAALTSTRSLRQAAPPRIRGLDDRRRSLR